MTAKRANYGLTRLEGIVVFSTISVIAAIAVPNFIDVSSHPRVSPAKSDMRSLATGIESYCVDHKAYPPMARLADYTKNQKALLKAGGSDLPSIHCGMGTGRLEGLTTPVSYIASLDLYRDRFSPDPAHLPFVYFTDRTGWILVSPGPDRKYDIDPARDYDGKLDVPTTRMLALTYDPTNGGLSRGDVWRIRN